MTKLGAEVDMPVSWYWTERSGQSGEMGRQEPHEAQRDMWSPAAGEEQSHASV